MTEVELAGTALAVLIVGVAVVAVVVALRRLVNWWAVGAALLLVLTLTQCGPEIEEAADGFGGASSTREEETDDGGE